MSSKTRRKGKSGKHPYSGPESERPAETSRHLASHPQESWSRGRGKGGGSGRPEEGFQENGIGRGRARVEKRGHGNVGLVGQIQKIEKPGEYVEESKFQSSDKKSDEAGRSGGEGRQDSRSWEEEILKTKPETCVTKKGVTGCPVTLTTNYFDIESIPNWVLYKYVVTFDIKETEERDKRAWLFNQRGEGIKSVFIFDGNHIYTPQRLTNKDPDVLKLTTVSREEKTIHIDIRFVSEMRRGSFAYLQVFSSLNRRCLGLLNLHLLKRQYFDPAASLRLPQHYLELWPGYLTTIRQYDGGIMMCSRILHKVIRTDTAFELLVECLDSSNFKRNFQQAIIGAIVLTDYTNKTYQVADVDFDKNPTSTFVMKGRETTFVDYYKQKYGINIRDWKQPLLVIRKKSKAASEDHKSTTEILLVPELCRMTGLTRKMKDNKMLMRNIAGVTRMSPQKRIESLQRFNARLHSNPKVLEDFKSWGLKLSRNLKTVQGRVLPPEVIEAGNGRTFTSGNGNWMTPLRSGPMFLNRNLNRWVFVTTQKLKDTVNQFLPSLKKSADGMHFQLPTPIIMTTRTENASEIVDAVEKALTMHKPDLIVFGLPSDRPDRYSAVKRKCCVDRGVPSQVILSRTMTSKGALTIANKVVVQINVKMGGVPWSVPIPTDNCMVVGFDVCHGQTSKSVRAMVASTSPKMTTWFSSVNRHCKKGEPSFFLANDIYKALVKYREKNEVLPLRLIVYRDGVGEGQIALVLEHEVKPLKEKLNEVYDGQPWKLTYIIVNKRISTRLFLDSRNPGAGTIVDDNITQPERYDFYMVSQEVKDGGVSPTLYNIISDNSGWSPDRIQRFTYKMTHLYYNSTSPIQVPAPCQYAHKLASLTYNSLDSDAHPNLQDKLFFL